MLLRYRNWILYLSNSVYLYAHLLSVSGVINEPTQGLHDGVPRAVIVLTTVGLRCYTVVIGELAVGILRKSMDGL